MKIQFAEKLKPKFGLAHTRPGRRLGESLCRLGLGWIQQTCAKGPVEFPPSVPKVCGLDLE